MRSVAMLGLGTAVFLPGYGVDGRGVTDPDALLKRAVDGGIRYVDTAAGYGSSEEWLGSASAMLDAARVRVCTKLTARELPHGIPESLRRLRRSNLDTLLVHSAGPRELTDPRTAAAMTAAKHRGSIRLAGASTYGVENARLALAQSWCDALQVEFSVLNPSVVRGISDLRGNGREIVVRSVLAQGMLTSTPTRASRVPGTAAAVLDRLEAVANEWGLTLEQLAIRFALDAEGVDVVLVGVANETELAVALSAADAPALTPAQIARLAEFDYSREDWTHPERWGKAT